MITLSTEQIVQSLKALTSDPQFLKSATDLMTQVAVKRNSQLMLQAWQDYETVRRVEFSSASTVTNLATARDQNQAYAVPFKFKSIRVEKASGADVEVKLIVGKNLSGRDFILLRQNDTINFDYLTEGWLYWDAQAGETMQILFGIDVEFRQGSLISESTGGVVISEGTDVETAASATVATTAGVLLAADLTRKMSTIQNKSGASIWLGDSTVTALTGFELPANAVYEFKNTDALYAIASGASAVDIRIMHFR
jgi:hypothetical protein